MEKTMDAPTPEDKKPFKFSIQVTQGNDGDLGMQALGDGFRLIDCRRMLEWALNTVNDKIHDQMIEEYIKAAANKKVVQNGFRPRNLLSIFK